MASGPKPGASTNFAIPAHEAKIVHESLLTCKASGNNHFVTATQPADKISANRSGVIFTALLGAPAAG